MTAPLSSLADHADERFTEAQLAKVAEFDAAPEPPEIVVERVARAMFERPLAESASASWHEVSEGIRMSFRADARAAIAAMPASPADSVLVDGDWVSPSREAHARDLTKSWADAAQNAGCPAAFVARMRTFVEVHDRNYCAAIAALDPS